MPSETSPIQEVELTEFNQEKQSVVLGVETAYKKANPIKGLIFAIILGLLSAIIWGLIAKVTNRNIGFVAILAGFMVSIGFSIGGKSSNSVWGAVGAAIAVLSIVLGNAFTVIFFAADYLGVGVIEVLPYIDFTKLPGLIIENFSIIDLVFYYLAFRTAYNGSFNKNVNQVPADLSYTVNDL